MPIARKRFGQHWLRSETALAQIVGAATLTATDRVLEIGPGTGILTKRLLPLVQSVVAVEIDRDLCELLRKSLGAVPNFHLIEGDFLNFDLATDLLQPLADPSVPLPNKVVANIPYNITAPILEKLLGTIAQPNPHRFDSIVLLIQKEVAERLCAQPSSKAFGALSVRVQYLADCQWICTVPAKAFQPPPKIDSAVVRLHPRPFEPAAADPVQLDRLVRLGFSARRKMLRNNLQSLIDREHLNQILEQLQLNPQARAEDLSLADWVALTNQIQTGSVCDRSDG